jgi:hypothetical protein
MNLERGRTRLTRASLLGQGAGLLGLRCATRGRAEGQVGLGHAGVEEGRGCRAGLGFQPGFDPVPDRN